MEWIYLSPHFDDVAFSCGGLIWEQTGLGEKVSIWTICACEPPPGSISEYAQSLHKRWETGPEAVAARRAEDLKSSRLMGASSRNFPIPDAIYRSSRVDGRSLYTADADLFTELNREEDYLVESLRIDLEQALPQECKLVCPLALGGHVDHRLTRSAAEKLGKQMGLVFRCDTDPAVYDHQAGSAVCHTDTGFNRCAFGRRRPSLPTTGWAPSSCATRSCVPKVPVAMVAPATVSSTSSSR